MISPVTIAFITIIVSSAYGMVIDCDYELQSFSLPISNVYACIVTKMSSENPTIVEAIRGNHTEGMNNSDVRGYKSLNCEYLSYCPKSFPKNVGNFFPNLVAFVYTYSFLESISADALESMPNLVIFEVGVNSLTSLDSDLFQYTPKVVFINLSSNFIQHIGKDIFIGMASTTLIFFNNTCIDTTLWYNEQQKKATNEQLLLSCPPLTVSDPTTTAPTTRTTSAPTTLIEEQCLARCSLNDEIDELKVQVNKLSLLNAQLDERLLYQHQRIAGLEKHLGMYY